MVRRHPNKQRHPDPGCATTSAKNTGGRCLRRKIRKAAKGHSAVSRWHQKVGY